MEQAAPQRDGAAWARGDCAATKPLPAFVDQFGWCTWDAFYQEVSHEKVREGLESFRRAASRPKLLILDDGWQSVAHVAHRRAATDRLRRQREVPRRPGPDRPDGEGRVRRRDVPGLARPARLLGRRGRRRRCPATACARSPRRYSPGILHHCAGRRSTGSGQRRRASSRRSTSTASSRTTTGICGGRAWTA